MVFPQLKSSGLPLLENGDRLSREEFERRYIRMTNLKKAELIAGVVYVASPLKYRHHALPHGDIMAWLGLYRAFTPGVYLADNATVRLDSNTEVQPDALLRIDETKGGQSCISEDDYIEGAPELIVEIAATSASYDLHNKLEAYCRNGVQEYLVWVTQEHHLCWYLLRGQEYIEQEPDQTGVMTSKVLPGLYLATNALLNGKIDQVLNVLKQGLDSHEHREFVHHLLSS